MEEDVLERRRFGIEQLDGGDEIAPLAKENL
jgi:hypothetical protein